MRNLRVSTALFVGSVLIAACSNSPDNGHRALPVSSSAASALSTGSGLFTVTQNLLPGLAQATDLGPAAGGTPLTLLITIARPNPAGEEALLDALHDPTSPQFEQFLTVDEFAAEFGVPQSTLDQVTAWLQSGGLTVAEVSAANDQITVNTDVAHVDALMRTATHAFSYSGGPFIANTAAPTVPYGLGITNIVGLNTLQRFSLPARTPDQTGCRAPGTCVGVTTPQDLWSVYEQPSAFTGAGQKVAIFGEGRTDDVIADLRVFEAKFGLSQVPVTVVHPKGETNFTDDSGLVEWNIDTQASTGMAPGVDELRLYFGTDLSDASVLHVFQTWTDDRTGPLQASASYGECEAVPVVSPIAGQPALNPALPAGQGLGNNIDATATQILRQAAIHGKTLFSSTGDTGSSCPVVYAAIIGAGNGVANQGAPLTNSPASLPYVVGVGGTVLYTDGSGHRSHEYGWAYSGGGSTLYHPAPKYQRSTPGLLACVTDPSTPCRGIADVSSQSGDVATNGYEIISGGARSVGGGTSLSSPLWLGMWARVQSAARTPKGNGFANYPLYRVGNSASYARDFFDVTSTDPSTGLPAGNGLYLTTPGWDYVTGFGTPRVGGLICDIDHKGC